jgi:uncharacterized coiled-coil protein SlyX
MNNAEYLFRRKESENRVKELEERLANIQDPERVKKLEDTIKKQRLANDNLQQQFVMQVERIADLEKKLKEYRAEKLEYETKYEERVIAIQSVGCLH